MDSRDKVRRIAYWTFNAPEREEDPMLLRNCWYVAAYDHEVGRLPLGRIILGKPMVFYPLEDGTPDR
jgi:phenylpropionate dioxygenase-like ring-hydroxylating dioxygenase large terminal subunit